MLDFNKSVMLRVCGAAFFLLCSVSLVAPVPAQAGERPMIIGFHKRPGFLEEALVHGQGGKIKRRFRHLAAYAANLSEEAAKHLRKDPRVKYVAEDVVYRFVDPVGTAAPIEYQNAWGVDHIGSMEAHASNINGAGVRIAVLDSGIDYNHEELASNYMGGWDFVFDDSDPADDSWNSHGTHVAGIIAAAANGRGVVGVAPNADLYAVKVLDGGGFGLASWIAAGIEWAVDNGIDIVNMSIGGPHSQLVQDACDHAYAAGILLVASAGNKYGILYPAAYDSVMAVTGTDEMDLPGSFAPTGPQIELAAPGDAVQSAIADNSYGELSGTSQAAPHVAGVAALIYAAGTYDLNGDGAVNNEDVRYQLQASGLDLGEAGKDNVYGYGLVDVPAALLMGAGGTTFDLVRNPRRFNNWKIVDLSGMEYQVVISNYSLQVVEVDVYANGTFRPDLSDMFLFNGKREQKASFTLDATSTDFSLVFSPIGRPGASAAITIINK